MAGASSRAADRSNLCLPSQRRDLIALRVDLSPLTDLLQVGRHGGVCFASRATCALSVPARHRADGLRRYPPLPQSPEGATYGRHRHDPCDQQRDLRRHLLGPPRVRHKRRRDRAAALSHWSRSPLRQDPCRVRIDRPWSPNSRRRDGAGRCSPRCQRPDLEGQYRRSRARASRRGATQLRSALVCIRPAVLDGLEPQLRGERLTSTGVVLQLVLPVLVQSRASIGGALRHVAEDHTFR